MLINKNMKFKNIIFYILSTFLLIFASNVSAVNLPQCWTCGDWPFNLCDVEECTSLSRNWFMCSMVDWSCSLNSASNVSNLQPSQYCSIVRDKSNCNHIWGCIWDTNWTDTCVERTETNYKRVLENTSDSWDCLDIGWNWNRITKSCSTALWSLQNQCSSCGNWWFSSCTKEACDKLSNPSTGAECTFTSGWPNQCTLKETDFTKELDTIPWDKTCQKCWSDWQPCSKTECIDNLWKGVWNLCQFIPQWNRNICVSKGSYSNSLICQSCSNQTWWCSESSCEALWDANWIMCVYEWSSCINKIITSSSDVPILVSDRNEWLEKLKEKWITYTWSTSQTGSLYNTEEEDRTRWYYLLHLFFGENLSKNWLFRIPLEDIPTFLLVFLEFIFKLLVIALFASMIMFAVTMLSWSSTEMTYREIFKVNTQGNYWWRIARMKQLLAVFIITSLILMWFMGTMYFGVFFDILSSFLWDFWDAFHFATQQQ